MKKTWVEIICDGCGCADYYPPGDVNQQARENGWIITADGKHFCDPECRTKFKQRVKKWNTK